MTIEVGILGATGMVGQQFIALLAAHPWFKVTWLGASERSAGKAYRDACAWRLPSPLPADVARLQVQNAAPVNAPKLVFSGLDSSVAGEIEGAFAQAGHVIVSNSRNYRMEADVPLLIPEVNADHLALLTEQSARGWKGRIVTNPNCVVVVYAMALAPLRQFGLKTSILTSLQAISGAGYPGVPSWDILGNVIPFIGGGEEEKIETEPRKILGAWQNDRFIDAPFRISAQVNRVPTIDGHLMTISMKLRDGGVDLDAIRDAIRNFTGEPQRLNLPSAPKQPVHYASEPDRPQPRLDRERERGMAVTVGRLRPCPLLDIRMVALVHNTIRGAAGAALLNAELLEAKGML
jgi:aspartate-semialdehyde dehydrogenase